MFIAWMEGLDKKDCRILYELELDARQSDSRIAKKVGLSRDAVGYRIGRMQEQGYIKGFITHINTIKLGYTWYSGLFKFHNLTLAKEKELNAWLEKNTNWAARVEGVWDIATGIMAKDVYEYNSIIAEFFDRFNLQIKEHKLEVMLHDWICTKEFLLDKETRTNKPLLLGFETAKRRVEKIDKTDMKILESIATDARKKTTDIARETGLTEMIVSYRMKKMKQQNVILGCKPFINRRKLDMALFKVVFTLQRYTLDERKQFFNYLVQHPLVDRVTEFIPRTELEVTMTVKTLTQLYEEIAKMRNKFNKIIGDHEMLHFVEEIKNVQLPLR
jgi:DNA-binding Lrp family transcriptional regulator